jgi:hypothetical protein
MTIYPASVYSIGTGYTIALILGAYFSDGYFLDKIPELSQKPRLMALLYLGGSIICLALALIQSPGAIINIDRLV